jgi:hypothetical protein
MGKLPSAAGMGLLVAVLAPPPLNPPPVATSPGSQKTMTDLSGSVKESVLTYVWTPPAP